MNINYYWINIDTSIYRRKFMELQFQKLNITNQRISAITPSSLQNFINDTPPYHCGNSCCNFGGNNDCPLEYSCSTSHLEAIKVGHKSNADYFVVCEDDIYFPFNINYEAIIKDLPEDWDIFQMMVLDDGANTQLYELYERGINWIRFNPNNRLFSTGMYLINRRGAKKLMKQFIDNKSNKYELTSKTQIRQADFLLYMNVNTYTSTFPYCYPNLKFISEIHPNHYFLHMASINKIKENLNKSNNKNKYITSYHDFDEFEKDFISLISDNNNT